MASQRRGMTGGRLVGLSVLSAFLLSFAGCGPEPLHGNLAEFERAGRLLPMVDVDSLTRAKLPGGPYRVVVDDLLELHMPTVMREVLPRRTDILGTIEPVLCRVGTNGTIRLPIVGEIPAEGKTLAEIESAVVGSYYPKYAKNIPAVAGRVIEHSKAKISIVGAVENPGIYELRSDEMSLVAALMKAGGVIPEGAAAISIRRATGPEDSQPLLLPIKGLNIPFVDVSLKGGDAIEVGALCEQNFTVIGLVKNPGVFPYPTGVRYNLAQALACAGGVDHVGDPQYVKICRQDVSGRLLAVPFRIGGDGLVRAAGVCLKPGDVVAVEKTARTEARLIILRLLRVSFGIHGSYRI